nr:flagellar hook-length control protein FliK [Angustibacter aerolatus]
MGAAHAATRDGVHQISVRLHPADLGVVQVVATLGEQGVQIHLHAATESTREALRHALGDLHHDLAQAGSGGVSVDVSDHAPQQQAADTAAQWAAAHDGADRGRGSLQPQAIRAEGPRGGSDATTQRPAQPAHRGADQRLDLRV